MCSQTDSLVVQSLKQAGQCGFFCSEERQADYVRYALEQMVQVIEPMIENGHSFELIVGDSINRSRLFLDVLPIVPQFLSDDDVIANALNRAVAHCEQSAGESESVKSSTEDEHQLKSKIRVFFLINVNTELLDSSALQYLLRYGKLHDIYIILFFKDGVACSLYRKQGDLYFQRNSTGWHDLVCCHKEGCPEKPLKLAVNMLQHKPRSFDEFISGVVEQRNSLLVDINLENLLAGIDKWSQCADEGIDVPIGWNEDGQVFNMTLNHAGSSVHAMLSGSSGAGKSNLLKLLICSCMHSYPPEELQIALIDLKRGHCFQ